MKYSDIMQTRYWTPARKFRLVRRALLAVSLVALMAVRFIPGGGEFYASHLYPAISSALSAVSSLTTYSLEEIYVVLATVMLITYPVIARVRYLKWKHVAITEMEIVLAVYSWFYWGWGLNYFRDSFYERQSVKPAKYDKEAFRSFLKEYTLELNRSEQESDVKRIDRKNIEKDIRDGYNRERDLHGLCEAKDRFEPKKTLFNGLYSGVGVSGYMGPFFCEMQINGDLPDEQFAFTYAHELALPVVFESGIQHMADRPEGFAQLPEEAKKFLRHLPAAWDDTSLLDGYPGESVLMRRDKGDTIYVAGINGTDKPMKLASRIKLKKGHKYQITKICDSDAADKLRISSAEFNGQVEADCLPKGGFVAVIVPCKK